MNTQHEAKRPRLWISYPWARKEEQDFHYLVSELGNRNIEATYDSVQLVPNAKLQERILQRLRSIGFDGWLYILTHQVLTQRQFAEELIAAIDTTHRRMGLDFPVMGLLHNITAQILPQMLRAQPCLSLADPNWTYLVSSALKGRTVPKREAVRIASSYVWKVHPSWDGDPSKKAVEVGTHGESVPCWRFGVPTSTQPALWGVGAAGGKEISAAKFGIANGAGRCENTNILWFGAAHRVSDRESAFLVFPGPLPEFICFGPAESFLGPPGKVEVFRTKQDVSLLLRPE